MECLLKVNALTKKFGRFVALEDVTFSLTKGEVLVIIGPSGSGKTTLLKCLNLVIFPTLGSIELVGQEVYHASLIPRTPLLRAIGKYMLGFDSSEGTTRHVTSPLHTYRRNFGMVFQDFNLWPNMTLFGNIAAPLKWGRSVDLAEVRDKVRHYAELVQIDRHLNKLPSEVSGGEKQRAAIARALIVEPKVLLLDEITSALDPELVSEMLKLINKLKNLGHTMVVVTHHMQFAQRLANRIGFLHRGKLIELRDAKEFFDQPSRQELKEFLDRFREL